MSSFIIYKIKNSKQFQLLFFNKKKPKQRIFSLGIVLIYVSTSCIENDQINLFIPGAKKVNIFILK